MAVTTAFLLFLLVLGTFMFVGWLIVTWSRKPQRDERRRANELEALVDNIREIAYAHRDLDSALASIITDEIRTFENRQRKELR